MFFWKKLRLTINEIKRSNKYIIVYWDVNYNLLHHKHNQHVNEFVNIMYSNFLHPCITEPTRLIKKQEPSLIDNIFVNFFNKKIISGNLFDKISDHLSSFVVIKDINNKQTKRKFKIRDMKNLNQNKYLKDLKEIENLNLLKYKNADVMFNFYQDKLISIIDKHAPYRTLSRKEQKLRLKSWITKSILNSINKIMDFIGNKNTKQILLL